MGVGDDRHNKPTSLMGPDHLASLTVAQAAPTAKGSDRIARDRIVGPTVHVPPDVVPLVEDDKKTRKMEAEQFRELLRAGKQADTTAPLPISIAKKIIEESRTPEPPEPRNATTTAELLAQVDDAFADFGPDAPDATPPPQDLAVSTEAPVEISSKPVKQPALIVPDHRLDTRFAAAIAPITKPADATKTSDAIDAPKPRPKSPAFQPVVAQEARTTSMLLWISLLGVAIVVGTLVVLLT